MASWKRAHAVSLMHRACAPDRDFLYAEMRFCRRGSDVPDDFNADVVKRLSSLLERATNPKGGSVAARCIAGDVRQIPLNFLNVGLGDTFQAKDINCASDAGHLPGICHPTRIAKGRDRDIGDAERTNGVASDWRLAVGASDYGSLAAVRAKSLIFRGKLTIAGVYSMAAHANLHRVVSAFAHGRVGFPYSPSRSISNEAGISQDGPRGKPDYRADRRSGFHADRRFHADADAPAI